MNDNYFYDVYLWVIPNNDNLFKLEHLTMQEANQYAMRWFDMNELHDYMIVTEDSTPWSEPAPTITVKTPDWIDLEYNKFKKA